MRVVLDTNILISACWNPRGLESRALAMTISGPATPCITNAVWAEYREVLGRKKFVARRDFLETLLVQFEARALLVGETETLTISGDEEDNRFLECASAAKAEYLITGNLRHFPVALGITRIVNAREFLNTVLGDAFQES